MSNVIKREGWNNWGKALNEQTSFYGEYANKGEGADISERVSWVKQLDDESIEKYSILNVLGEEFVANHLYDR